MVVANCAQAVAAFFGTAGAHFCNRGATARCGLLVAGEPAAAGPESGDLPTSVQDRF